MYFTSCIHQRSEEQDTYRNNYTQVTKQILNMSPIGFILIAIQVIAYVLYYTYTKRNFGIQDSISDVFRRSQEKFGTSSILPWIFYYGFMLGIGVPFHLIILSGWSFFTMSGLILTATAAQFWRDEMTETAHIVGATGGITLAFVALGFKMWIVSTVFFVIYLLLLWLLRPIKNYTWWIESAAVFIVVILDIVYLLM